MSVGTRRHELTDWEWARIEPLLPPRTTRGSHYRDHRVILNGMLYWLHTGVPWRDLPERYGPWQTVYSRFRRWTREGHWERILDTMRRELDGLGQVEWTLWCVDGSSVRAHKAAAGAGKNPVAASQPEPGDPALGRSRGGWGTKLHLVTDGAGLPLAVTVSAGQAHESQYIVPTLRAVTIRQRRGRPRCRPARLAGDRGYDLPEIRRWLTQHGVRAVIPQKRRPIRWRPRRGRPLHFDRAAYRRRNVIERCVGWLTEHRRVATRYEKLAVHYLGVLHLAMLLKYLRTLSNTP